jgi:hypothetical protein
MPVWKKKSHNLQQGNNEIVLLLACEFRESTRRARYKTTASRKNDDIVAEQYFVTSCESPKKRGNLEVSQSGFLRLTLLIQD